MHPNRAFEWQDREATLALVADVAFCTIAVDGPFVVHAPVIVDPPDRLRFHIARGNRAAAAMQGRAIVSCLGPDAYISPDWYGTPDQVPTELSRCRSGGGAAAAGRGRTGDIARRAERRARGAADAQARLTRDKMAPGRFEAMLKAITGYELTIEALRGTRKLGQNKKPQERAGAAEGLAPFHPLMAKLMREAGE